MSLPRSARTNAGSIENDGHDGIAEQSMLDFFELLRALVILAICERSFPDLQFRNEIATAPGGRKASCSTHLVELFQPDET